jgi:hypothetical protein
MRILNRAMSNALQSASSRHKQAAVDHEAAARYHRAAAAFHDKTMLHAAQLSSEGAWHSCIKAHRESLAACERSAESAEPTGR